MGLISAENVKSIMTMISSLVMTIFTKTPLGLLFATMIFIAVIAFFKNFNS